MSVLAEKTLLKTAYHFLLLLVGFDTLTYRKDYDRSPTLVGHQRTLVDRKHYVNVVDVVECLHDPTDPSTERESYKRDEN